MYRSTERMVSETPCRTIKQLFDGTGTGKSTCRATKHPPGGTERGNRHAVPRNILLVARNGAGAKKCWGPAPQYKNNILKVRNLSFYGAAGYHKKSAPEPFGNQVSTRSSLSLALEQGFRHAMPRNALLVARGRIFGEGCPNLECHAPTGFRANRRERTSGPDEGGGAAKQKDGVCPTTLDRAFCPDQKEEFAVQQSRRTSPPFPDVSPKACGGRADGT